MLNKKISIYLLITFIITWGSWFTVAALLGEDTLKPPLFVLYVFGGLGPTFSAFITMKLFGDKSEYKDFLKQTLRAKAGVKWYLFIIVAPLVLTLLPWLVNSVITGKQQLVLQQPLYMLLAMIPVMIIGGGLEELGWRGVLLPGLLKKQSVLTSTIIVSITWVIWHIPLWFIKGVNQYGSNYVEFAFAVIGLGFLLSVVYIKTKSIFMCVLFHSIINSYMAIFSTPCLDTMSEVINISVKLIIAVGIFIMFFTFGKKNAYIGSEAV